MITEKKLPNMTVNAFAFGTFTASLYFSMVNSYFNYFVTDIALVPAGILGTANFIIRLLLVVAVPIMAALVQNGHSKYGKYRFWIFATMPIVAVCSVLTFTKFNGSAIFLAVFYSVAYALASGLIGMAGNSQMALMPVMADNATDRRRLSTRRSQFQDISKILFSATFLPLIALIGGNDSAKGYFWVAVIIAVLCYVGYLATAWSGKKYDVYPDDSVKEEQIKRDKMTGKQMLDSIIKNPPLIIILLIETIKFTGFMIFISTFAYYFKYILHDFSKITPIMTIASVAAVGSSFLSQVIIKYLGRKNTNVLAMLCYAIGALLPRFLPPDVAIFGIGFVLIYFGMSMQTCAGPLMFADAADYYELKTGIKPTGFVMSLYVFPVQIGIALVGGIINWILNGMGYVAGAELTASQLISMQNLILLLPGIMFVVSMLLAMVYPLNVKKLAEIKSQLDAKRAGTA